MMNEISCDIDLPSVFLASSTDGHDLLAIPEYLGVMTDISFIISSIRSDQSIR